MDAEAFKPSNSQKKAIKKFHKYLIHGRSEKEDDDVTMKDEEVKEPQKHQDTDILLAIDLLQRVN